MAVPAGIAEAPEYRLWWKRAQGTLVVIHARKTAVRPRTEGQGVGGWTDGHTAPQRPSLGTMAGTNPTGCTPAVSAPPSVLNR